MIWYRYFIGVIRAPLAQGELLGNATDAGDGFRQVPPAPCASYITSSILEYSIGVYVYSRYIHIVLIGRMCEKTMTQNMISYSNSNMNRLVHRVAYQVPGI